MDNEPSIEDELHAPQMAEEHTSAQDRLTGAFFPQAQNFVVAGGHFNSITNITQLAPDLPPDFRRFPIGDLDLRNEIQLGRSGEVYRQHGRRSARRVYSARIHGSISDMTVVMYQGDNSEQEWCEDISQYSRLRHPNIVQLFGIASACGMHAAIFNEELIPVQQLLEKYSGSHLWTVYLWSFLNAEFDEAHQYSQSVSGPFLHSPYCTMWIRPSTGRLCVDPTASEDSGFYIQYLFWDAPFSSTLSVLELPEDSNIVDSLSLNCYHQVCDWYFRHFHQLSIPTNTSVQLWAVISAPPGSDINHSKEIACIPDQDIDDRGWSGSKGASLTVLESGWTGVDSSEASKGYFSRRIWVTDGGLQDRAWLVQANHIFHRLGIASNHDNYVLITRIEYELNISDSGNSIPPGYLFLCPLADLQLDIPSHFRLPECPVYWSLDPSGTKHLTIEEVEELGFPTFKVEMKVHGRSWDYSVYNGICQFHLAKGFDPDSQNVARELGCPLYEISTEFDDPFAHIQTINVCDDQTETQEAQDSPQQTVHPQPGLAAPPLQKGLPPATNAENPAKYWKIMIGMQLGLLLALGTLGLYHRFH